MQANQDDLVHVQFTGAMVDKLLEIDEEMYLPYVTWEGNQKVMYEQLLKALYGMVKAANLFWERLTEHLVEHWGFTINLNDSCVANKIIKGHQCTVVWHVDDLKISHQMEEVVNELVNGEFGAHSELTMSSGTSHIYLGMTLDFSKAGQLQVNVIGYIMLVLDGVPNEIKGTAVTPAASHLFWVNEGSAQVLDGDWKDLFHHTTMQLAYLSQCTQPDIQIATPITFLQTWVTCPDEDNFKKLTWVVKYLHGTIDMILTLSLDTLKIMTWWVDVSYAVHDDMKGHTGGTMSLGQGSVYSTSSKQKLVS